MPKLACRSCGRQIYTVSPLQSLFAEERRCPRCGAGLDVERREAERRTSIRRGTTFADEEEGAPQSGEPEERRIRDRRAARRRRSSDGTTRSVAPDQAGWTD
jgi:hypothetical protein